jgi:predicted metal-dependent RNase
MVKHTITLDYEEVTDVTPDVRITLYNAGHILGSSLVHMHVGNGLHNIVYTSDLKYGKTMLLDPAVTRFPRLETLMIESTYGGKEDDAQTRKDADIQMTELIKRTVARNGKVLLPVLGVGRAQEILLLLEHLHRTGQIPPIPVFIDGMVWDVTAIHTAYPEYLNASVRKLIFHKNQSPFLSEIFKRVGSPKERRQVIEDTGACVILATSGMMQGGASVEYLKALADNPNNSMAFTCYQGPGSLGRRIQRGEREFTMKNTSFAENQPANEIVQMKMEIDTIEGFSGHSSRKELLNYIYKCDPKPKKVIVNHGENASCLDFASTIHKLNRIETCAPRNLEAVRLK